MSEATAKMPPNRDNPDIDQNLPGGGNDGDRAWLTLAEQAFRMSTDYLDANLRRQWERNISNLMGIHPQGSKYHGNDYRRRSRLFRPKTRAAERDFESAVAVAFFSSEDVANVSPENHSDDVEVASAEVGHYLLNYHLNKNVPWFKTVVGAAQDAWTYGIVWSEQSWKYKTRDDGTVIKDHPNVRIIPVENMRVDPACDWADPVDSSPYIIEIMPMYITDVIDKMTKKDDRTGAPEWTTLTPTQLQSTRRIEHEEDSTRMAREGRYKRDRMGNNHEVTAYDIVWIHKNIINVRGRDYFYFTAGTQYMLTQPVPLDEVYPDGRPYVLGNVVIDTHRVNPSSVANLSQDLQSQANSIVNQRIDNVELAMNARFLVDRGSGTDRGALSRSVPGGAILTDDMEGVRELKNSDVTRSSYEEQDRLNADFDDIAGSFSTSSVASNRSLNETVGGMNLMSQGSDALTEYQIRVFSETWYELVVRQVLKLIQRYETDERILKIAADKAKLFQKFGIDRVTDKMLAQELTTTISVGFNATNPQKRMEKLQLAVKTTEPYLLPGELNRRELSREVFGAAGYKDGLRFVNIPPEGEEQPQPPSDAQVKADMEMKILQMKLEDAEKDRKSKEIISEREMKTKATLAEKQAEIDLIKLASVENLTVEEIKTKYQINQDNIGNDERKVAIDLALKKKDKDYDPGQRLGG
jgi:hypothetical protein